MSSLEQIVVLRALPGLGDLLCVIPALRSLRHARPAARIALVGLPSVRALASRFSHYLDEFLAMPGFPGLPERPAEVRALPGFLSHVHARHFDLALQMHGNGTISNLATLMLGARITAGFYVPGQFCPDPRWFFPYPEGEPEIRRCLQLIEAIGIPSAGEELEFPLLEEDFAALAKLPAAQCLAPGDYACIHPGASDPAKCWPPERFAAAGDFLAARGLAVVLTGTEAERARTQAVATAMRSPSIDLAGQSDLPALAALLSRARLLVANDTGVSHLAAALRTASVVIFSQSDPKRWAPLDGGRHRAIGTAPGNLVEMEEVLAAAEELLSGRWRQGLGKT